MKCICGYEQLDDWETDDYKAIGDEKFIYINIDHASVNVGVRQKGWGGELFINDRPAYLYACPKCGMICLKEFEEYKDEL